jgi:hypothetical protein
MSDLGYLKILLSGATLFAPLDVNNISSTRVLCPTLFSLELISDQIVGPVTSL